MISILCCCFFRSRCKGESRSSARGRAQLTEIGIDGASTGTGESRSSARGRAQFTEFTDEIGEIGGASTDSTSARKPSSTEMEDFGTSLSHRHKLIMRAAAEKAAERAVAEKAVAEKAAAEKAAAERAAAEKAAAEKAAAEKAATEKAPPREWWQPPDWMSVTAKPSGDAGKAEAEKAEAAEAEAAAAAARSPNPLANGTPGRAYNLGGYAPPPSRTKAELKEIIESERQKSRPPLSARLRMPLSPEPWLGGSVSTERHDRLLASRRRPETSKRGLSAATEAEPSYWSAMGWRSWRAS